MVASNSGRIAGDSDTAAKRAPIIAALNIALSPMPSTGRFERARAGMRPGSENAATTIAS